MIQKTRNSGIELLRIISMFMICMLHTLGHGGICAHAEGLNGIISLLLNILCFGAVDCFACVSGYCTWNKDLSINKLYHQWLQVLFYSLTLRCFFICLGLEAYDGRNIIRALLPVCSKQYWYFTAFCIMSLARPGLNLILQKADLRTIRMILAVWFVILCIAPCFPFTVGLTMHISWGMSPVWLGYLYLVGGGLARFGGSIFWEGNALKAYWGLILFFIFSLVIFVHVELVENFPILTSCSLYPLNILKYSSPLVTLAAVSLTYFCVELDIRSPILHRFVCLLGGTTFGIYLIHDHPSVRAILIEDKFSAYASFHPIMMTLFVISTSIIIYCVCTLIEFLRWKLFKSIFEFERNIAKS